MNPQSSFNEKRMVKCVLAICEKFFRQNRTLVISGSDYSSLTELGLLESLHGMEAWPIVVSMISGEVVTPDPPDWDPRSDDKHSAYILIVSNQEQVVSQLQQLQAFSAWNPWANFVVMLNSSSTAANQKNAVEGILSEMWRWKIMDVVVVVEEVMSTVGSADTVISIMSWFPYTTPMEWCNKFYRIVTVNSWTPVGETGRFRYDATVFPRKLQKNLKGCVLRLGTANFHPFVILENGDMENDSLSVDGIDIRTLLCITEYLNIRVQVIPNLEMNPWGSRLGNGTWTGMSGDLAYNRIDVAAAGWADNLKDHLTFEISHRYFTDMVKWYVPRAKPYPHWLGIVRVFTPSFWAAFFFAMYVCSRFLRSVSLNSKVFNADSARYTDFKRCFLDLWSVIVSSPVPTLPDSARFRVFFGCWMVYSFVVNTVFQTYVTSLLVDSGLQHQISSVDELAESGLDFLVMRFLFTFVDERLLKRLTRTQVLDSPSKILDNSVESGNAVTLLSKTFIANSANEEKFKNKIFPLVALNENFMNFNLVFAFKKGDPIVKTFNDVILHLVEAGLPAQFMRNITSSKRQSAGVSTTEYVPVSLPHLLSAVVIMLVGLGFSTLTFIIEMLLPTFCKPAVLHKRIHKPRFDKHRVR